MKKKEFVELLNEYMDEISDPKNKEEYEQYLKQLHQDNDLPEGTKLLTPTACFCMKSSIKGKGVGAKKPYEQKLFVNMCSTKEIGRPIFERVEQNSKIGYNWSVPYLLGVVRLDQDKKKEICSTVECAFHPHSYNLAKGDVQFREMMCKIAMDAVEKQVAKKDEVVSKDFKILKKLKCKGNTPATLTVRKELLKNPTKAKAIAEQMQKVSEEQQKDGRQKNEDFAPKLYKEFMSQSNTIKKEKFQEIQKKKFITELSETVNPNYKEDDDLDQEVEANNKNKIEAPQYKLLYSYETEYADFLESSQQHFVQKKPKNIIIEIKMPRINSLKGVILDINENILILNVPEIYYLEVKLPLPIVNEEANAKFEHKRKILKMTLPINQKLVQTDQQLLDKMNELKETKEEEEKDEKIKEKEQNQLIEQNDKPQQKEKEEAPKRQLEINENSLKFVQLSEQPENKEVVEPEKDKEKQEEQKLEMNEKQTKLVEPKQIIQELQQNENQEKQQDQSEQILASKEQSVKVEKSYQQINFITQETSDRFFFIISLPKYNKSKFEAFFNDNEILVLYEKEANYEYLWVQIDKSWKAKESNCSFVAEYIIVNIVKEQQTFWDNKFGGLIDLSDESKKTEFLEKIRSYRETQFQQQLDTLAKEEEEFEKQKQAELDLEMQKEQEKEEIIKKRLENISLQFLKFDIPFINILD